MKIKCLIVDDEQLARDMLEKFASQIPHLTIVGKCKNTHIAEQFLANQNVDLMLLDISMPGISGIEFLKKIEKPPKVIFTTAFSNYAVEGFDLEAIDYLLKPVDPDELNTAIDRAKQQVSFKGTQDQFDSMMKMMSGGGNTMLPKKILLKSQRILYLYFSAHRKGDLPS